MFLLYRRLELAASIKRDLCLGIMKWVPGKDFHIHSLYQVKLQNYEFFQVTCNYSVNVQSVKINNMCNG